MKTNDEINKNYEETLERQDKMIEVLKNMTCSEMRKLSECRKNLIKRILTFRIRKRDFVMYKQQLNSYKIVKNHLKMMKDFRAVRANWI